MSQMVSYLQDAVKATEDMSKYQFHSKKHSWYESRIASSKDMKWIEERETTMRRERRIEDIFEDMDHLTKLYAIQEFNTIIQNLHLQYKNITDQIHLYEDQVKRNGQSEMITSEKKQAVLNSYKEEEQILEREIHSYEQTISTYTNKYNTLKEEEMTIQQELESVEGVITHYKTLQEQNAQLIKEIEKEKRIIETIKEERRRTIDNLLNEEEAKELEVQRKALDASEREEAALMVEVEKLLKEMDGDVSLSLTTESDKNDLEMQIQRFTKRHSLLQHVCEEFVHECRENNPVAHAMEILFQYGGEMNLQDLKAEMKRTVNSNPSAVLSTIYSLLGNQIITIDRSTKEQKVKSMI